MAFTPQDDQGSVADANAYIAVADFNTHHTDRGVTKVVDGDFETTDIQAAIVLASDFLDARYRYVGERRTQQQTTEWPRFDAEDANEFVVFGIPQQIKESCAELALAELNSPGSLFPSVPTDSSGLAVKRLKQKLDVLELETEYFGGDNPQQALRPPIFYQAEWRLKKAGLILSNRRLARG